MPQADARAIVAELARRGDALAPGLLRAIYLEGSHADATAIATSDLDLTLIVADDADAAGRERLAAIAASLGEECGVELDADIADEATLARGVSPLLKEAGRLAWGEPVVARLPIVPLDAWTRDRLHTSYWRLNTLFGRAGCTATPLDYPDPSDDFFGYCARPVRLPGGATAPSTRDLIRHVGWMATALIALRTGRYVARKRDCHRFYADLIGDEWTPFIADVYARCRTDWGYLIPDELEGRTALRGLCARTLAFECHFLAVYREYAATELRSADAEARAQAGRVLGRFPLPGIDAHAARVADEVGGTDSSLRSE